MRPNTMGTKILRLLAPAALVLALVAPATGQVDAGADSEAATRAPAVEARLDSARAVLEAHRRARGIPGLSAAIAVGGEVVWAGGFGHANLQHGVPAGPGTIYRIASISKPIAAVSAMHLVERGRLDLDAPIRRYLPEFPEKRAPVTTRQLMSHTAGIRHYRGTEFLSSERYTDVYGPLEVFAGDSLLFTPGERYSYSTYGYSLVSAVVARAAERPFLEHLDATVIEPLGLRTLQPEHRDSIIAHHASFYMWDEGRRINAPAVDLSNKWAGGGLVSTPADIARFALALIDGELLDPATVDSMFTPQRTNDGEPIDYGLGWRVDRTADRRVIWHTGGAVGGSGVLLLYPDDGVVVSILANLSGGGHLEPARRIAELFLDRAAAARTTRDAPARAATPR